MKSTVVFLLLYCSSSLLHARQAAYKSRNLSPEVRPRDLVKRMTLDTKLAQIQSLWIQKSTMLNAVGKLAIRSAVVGPDTHFGAMVYQTGHRKIVSFHPLNA